MLTGAICPSLDRGKRGNGEMGKWGNGEKESRSRKKVFSFSPLPLFPFRPFDFSLQPIAFVFTHVG